MTCFPDYADIVEVEGGDRGFLVIDFYDVEKNVGQYKWFETYQKAREYIWDCTKKHFEASRGHTK